MNVNAKLNLIAQTNAGIAEMIEYINSDKFINDFNKVPKDNEEEFFELDCALLGANWRDQIKAVIPKVFTAELKDKSGNRTRRLMERSFQEILVGNKYEAMQLAKASTCAALIKCDDEHFRNMDFRIAMSRWIRRLEATATA